MLYGEAATREPGNSKYRNNRDALAPAAKILAKMDVQDASIAADLNQINAEKPQPETKEPPMETARLSAWERDNDLQPLPKLKPKDQNISFNLRGDERTLFQQVTTAFGLRVTFDPQMTVRTDLHFAVDQVNFETAMRALTTATGTFVFPISDTAIFVTRNTEEKRNQYEPHALLTFQLPNALEQKDLVEAANAVRTVLNIRSIGWDSVNRTVMVRDRVTRARLTQDLLESVLLPHAQVSVEVQVISVDTQKTYHYGLALPTSFSFAYLGSLGTGLRNVLPSLGNAANFLSFGGGASLFGLALTDSTLFATYTNAYSSSLFDATVNVSEGQTANFHVGDQYPIAQSIYTGFAQGAASIYNPVPQINLVDLGLVLKLTPKVGGDGNIALDVEAQFKALGNQTFNTVPSILQKEFKGTVNVREGESAVIAGFDNDTESVTRNGLVGLSQMPGVSQALSENMRDRQTNRTLIIVKPTLRSLPMSAAASPQFFMGPQRGQGVLF